jgi:hypothetical protein
LIIRCNYGLSDGAIPDHLWIGQNSNSYAIPIGRHYCYLCWLAGASHIFELPEGAIRPRIKENGNVFGCGIVLDPEDKLTIFFTLNGQLLGEFRMREFKQNKKKELMYISNLCFIIIHNYITV